MKTYLLLFILFISLLTSAQDGFNDYETKVEIPEPLFIDLVRGLGSKKGEWEVNSLAYHGDGGFSELNWAPEIEWAFADGTAVELELPMHGHSLHSYKMAAQKTVYSNAERSHLHGLQIIYETNKEWGRSDLTAYYISAHRFTPKVSTITLVGIKTLIEEFQGFTKIFNHTVFYNYSREIDVGVEFNYFSRERFMDQVLQVVPQLHLAMGDGFKLQFGFGGGEDNGRWTPVSMLRLIREFNKEH